MDGTLYDMHDLIEDGFRTAVRYMMKYYEFERDEAEKILNDNHIYPYVAPDARSTTQFFMSRFVDVFHWDSYRSRHFGYKLIVKEKAVRPEMLQRLSEVAPLVLLTNNTSVNVGHVLKQIGIPEETFAEILCNEKENKSPSKKPLMEGLLKKYEVLPEEALSIGDRYDVDALPMLELGGKALIIREPKAIERFLDEIEDPVTCEAYEYHEKPVRTEP